MVKIVSVEIMQDEYYMRNFIARDLRNHDDADNKRSYHYGVSYQGNVTDALISLGLKYLDGNG